MGAQAILSQGQAAQRFQISHHGAHESNEGWCQGHEPGRSRSSALREHGPEEGCMCECSEKLGGNCAQQVKKVGKFVLPGLCMIKTRLKPATKAGKREVFGKVVMVKAKPARTVVKAFPVSALKKAF